MRKFLILLATIIIIFGLVKYYKYYGRSQVYRLFYGHKIVEAFAKADISVQPAVECKNNKENIWLISYADKNPWLINQNALAASAVNKCVDHIKIYRPKHIDSDYLKKHEDIFSVKRGGGYWLWKPYLILKTLREMPENEILLYVDSGIMISEPLDTLLESLDERNLALFDTVFPNREYTTKKLFRMMDADREEFWSAGQINASRLIIRNSPEAREFIKKWLYWAEMPGALVDSDGSDEYPEFKDHRHDQSILSIVYEKNKSKVKILEGKDERYFFHHRRHDFDSRSLVFKKDILTKFETWLSKSAYKLLRNN